MTTVIYTSLPDKYDHLPEMVQKFDLMPSIMIKESEKGEEGITRFTDVVLMSMSIVPRLTNRSLTKVIKVEKSEKIS